MERTDEHRQFTTLADGGKVPKTDPRVVAVAHCRDAAASIGLALALGGDLIEQTVRLLGGVQNDLYDVAADLRNPWKEDGGGDGDGDEVRIDAAYIDRLRYLIDHYGGELEEPTERVIPGGTPAGALIHKARTAVHLAEARTWEAAETEGIAINRTAADYLDELSHLLLFVARTANSEHGDAMWIPGLSAKEAPKAEEAISETEKT